MPEVSLSSRDRELVRGPLPVWVSFEGSAGLLYRSQPVFENDRLIDRYETATTMNRLDFQPRLTTALRWREWNLIPSFAVRTTRYGETQDALPEPLPRRRAEPDAQYDATFRWT